MRSRKATTWAPLSWKRGACFVMVGTLVLWVWRPALGRLGPIFASIREPVALFMFFWLYHLMEGASTGLNVRFVRTTVIDGVVQAVPENPDRHWAANTNPVADKVSV